VATAAQATPGNQDGTYAFQAKFGVSGAVLEFSRSNVGTTFLDVLTFWVRKEDAVGNLSVAARLASQNGISSWVPLAPKYLAANNQSYAQFVPHQWFKVSIPLLAMGVSPGTTLDGILFKSDTATTAYFDDIGIVTAFLQFPLAGRTPYTMRVVAIQDHDSREGIIKAYDGEMGSGNSLCYDLNEHPCLQNGYKRSDTFGTFRLPLITYDEEIPTSPAKDFVWYDNHTGYDYAEPGMQNGIYPIYAAASGILCVANNTTVGDGVHLWRSPLCNIVDAPTTTTKNAYNISPCNNSTQWDCFHAIYVMHGVSNAYSSWYLHVGDIYPAFKPQIVQNGYAFVSLGDQIATVGNFAYGRAGGVGYHLHFGVRNYNGVRVDPYGDDNLNQQHGNFNLLWKQRPQ
jgi:hypothetical protein